MGWFIWGIAAFFYSYEFTQRVAPSVMIPELMAALHLDAAQLGSLSAYYFYTYALCQIPAGMLIDRYGPRWILTLAPLAVSLGSLAMVYSPSLLSAKASRALIGIGSAFAFIGCLKLAQHWIAKHHFPFMVGLTNLSGTLGALAGGAPLAFAVTHWGWQNTMLGLAILGLFISILLFFMIHLPKKPIDHSIPEETPISLIKHLKTVTQDRQTWLFAVYGGLLVVPIAAFVELWSVPFLTLTHAISRAEAAFLNSLIFVGIAIGGPTIGWLYSKLPNPILVCRLATLCAFICLYEILFADHLSLPLLSTLLLSYGFLTSNMLLCFTFVSQRHSKRFSGAALGLTNMVVVAGGALFQPLIGWLLDLHTAQSPSEPFETFSVADYHFAFTILPLCLLVAVFLTFFMKVPNLIKGSSI